MPVQKNMTIAELPVTFVTFHLENQTYALPITPVRQIIEMITITPLPQVNHTIVGVINFHGVLVPVVNLRRQLGLAEVPLQLHTPIILVNISERLVGLIVDEVLDVIDRPADQIIDPNDILHKEMGETPLLQGLIHAQDSSILLLNPEYLLKSYPAHTLLETVDTLTQSLKQSASDEVEGSQSSETSPPMQDVEEIVPNEPETQPKKLQKPPRRKKTIAQDEPEAKPGKLSKSQHIKKTITPPKTTKGGPA